MAAPDFVARADRTNAAGHHAMFDVDVLVLVCCCCLAG
jgi:hypothetical protein